LSFIDVSEIENVFRLFNPKPSAQADRRSADLFERHLTEVSTADCTKEESGSAEAARELFGESSE